MNDDTRWVVNAFLDDQDRIDVRNTNPPMHITDYRLALIHMVLTEVGDDDLECLAIRALAERTRDLCIDPASLPVIEAWVAARHAYLEIIKAAYGG